MTNENKENKTIDELSDEKAQEYYKIFLSFYKMPQFKDKARSLALRDIILQKWEAEFTLDKLTAKIDAFLNKHSKTEVKA